MLFASARFAQSCPVELAFIPKKKQPFFEVSIMHLKKSLAVTVFATIALMAGTSLAQISALNIATQATDPDLAGHTANDLLIDFSGQYTGSQMVVTLTSGAIYQNAMGAVGPPNNVLVDLAGFEALKWDTFVTQGSAITGGAAGETGIGGGAVNLGGSPTAQFNTEGINQGWNPAGGANVMDQSGFLVARVTLTNDAMGELRYIGSAAGSISVGGDTNGLTLPIVNGVVGGGGVVIPEPSTVILLAMGLVGLVALKRRNG
jgi:hypothetical protein